METTIKEIGKDGSMKGKFKNNTELAKKNLDYEYREILHAAGVKYLGWF